MPGFSDKAINFSCTRIRNPQKNMFAHHKVVVCGQVSVEWHLMETNER